MAGDILINPAATYAAITVLATTKVDSTSRTDAEVATYPIANWADEVDTGLIKCNAWFAGSQSAGISGNTSTLLGGLTVEEDFTCGGATGSQTLSVTSATSGGVSTIQLGSAAIPGKFFFRNTSNYFDMEWGVSGTAYLNYDTSALSPVSSGYDLGTSSVPFDKIYVNTVEATSFYEHTRHNFNMTSGALRYIPINYLQEGATISAYYHAIIAPYDGEIEWVKLYTDGNAGSTIIGLHVNENTTATETDTQTLNAATLTTFSFTGTSQFSAGDLLHLSIDPTNSTSEAVALVRWKYTP
jgi:hypothetical protein|tara:strand:- start:1040 stop:1933 length:894 start_codon:yes stop_codon:yes gene_type:complete